MNSFYEQQNVGIGSGMMNQSSIQPIRIVDSNDTSERCDGMIEIASNKFGFADFFTNSNNPDLNLNSSKQMEPVSTVYGIIPSSMSLLPSDGKLVREKIPTYNEETHGVYVKKGILHYQYRMNDRISDLVLINANIFLEKVYRTEEYSCNIMQIGITKKEGTCHFLLRQNCSEKELVEVLQTKYFVSKGSKIGWKEVEDILRNYLNTGMNEAKYEAISLFPGWKQCMPGDDYYYDFYPLQNKGTWFAKDLLVNPCEFVIPNVTAKESVNMVNDLMGNEGFNSSTGILISIAVMSVLQRMFAEQRLFNQMIFLFDDAVTTQRTVCNLLQFVNRDRQDIFRVENIIRTNQLLHEVKDRVCLMSCGGMNKAVEKLFNAVANTAVTGEKEAFTTDCSLRTIAVLFSGELVRKGVPNADNYILMESPNSIKTSENIFSFYYHFIRYMEEKGKVIKRLMDSCYEIIKDHDMGQDLSSDAIEDTATMLVISSLVTQWYIKTCVESEGWVPDVSCIQEIYDYVISVVEHDTAASITFEFQTLLHEMMNLGKITLRSGRYEENTSNSNLVVFYDGDYAYISHEAVKKMIVPSLRKVKSLRRLENVLRESNVLVANERGNTVQITGRDGKRHRVLRFVRTELFDEAEFMFNGGR